MSTFSQHIIKRHEIVSRNGLVSAQCLHGHSQVAHIGHGAPLRRKGAREIVVVQAAEGGKGRGGRAPSDERADHACKGGDDSVECELTFCSFSSWRSMTWGWGRSGDSPGKPCERHPRGYDKRAMRRRWGNISARTFLRAPSSPTIRSGGCRRRCFRRDACFRGFRVKISWEGEGGGFDGINQRLDWMMVRRHTHIFSACFHAEKEEGRRPLNALVHTSLHEQSIDSSAMDLRSDSIGTREAMTDSEGSHNWRMFVSALHSVGSEPTNRLPLSDLRGKA